MGETGGQIPAGQHYAAWPFKLEYYFDKTNGF